MDDQHDRTKHEQKEEGRRALIRHLNDELRRKGDGGQRMITAGIAAVPEHERSAIIAAVAAFDKENDPHRKHDLSLLQVGEHRVIFRIDAYDRELMFASPDPADPAVTCRVLTILLGEEY